jgi:amidase
VYLLLLRVISSNSGRDLSLSLSLSFRARSQSQSETQHQDNTPMRPAHVLLRSRAISSKQSAAAALKTTTGRPSPSAAMSAAARTAATSARAAASSGDDGDNDGGAFIGRFVLTTTASPAAPPSAQLPLAGVTVAVKDLYDVAGHRTAFGSPAWLATKGCDPAQQHSAAVLRLLAAGATLVGKTQMDELAYSLNGENAHYGTPVNPFPAANGKRIPGGSSSGSAAAVGLGLADAALGSDTGGSVRVPASYCGLLGHRPTHGRVPMTGARALAASFDTGGWLARDAATLRRMGEALLLPERGQAAARASARPRLLARPRWLVARDAFALASPQAARAVYEPLSARFEQVSRILGGPPTEVDLAPAVDEGEEEEGEGAAAAAEAAAEWRADLSTLAGWADVFRVAQAREIWREHGAWVEQTRAEGKFAFGPGVDDRLRMAAAVTELEARRAGRAREAVRRRLDLLLGEDGVLALPSAPGPAPLLRTPPERLDAWRRRLLSLTCVAGLAGLPQVSLPIGLAVPEDEEERGEDKGLEGEGEEAPPPTLLLPIGLSLIGPRGSDEALLAIAERLMEALGK